MVTASGSLRQLPLRDRRRAQTEREIGEAALTLFEQRGVGATTVDEIARLAGVSPRTFFRYFAVKELAALAPHRELENQFGEMLDGLRADRPVLPQLEAFWTDMLRRLDNGRSDAGRQLLRMRRLMCAEPSLRQAANRLDNPRADELVGQLAGIVGDEDHLGVRVLLSAAGAPVDIALDTWADATLSGLQVDLVAIYERCRSVLHDAVRA
ncbi:MAG TPA: TetR family transcriptional regulator [Solirubrobacteraceae bacterium]|nr:TetR family transcriptional regulator [Solirubrobacteraceae bacterium]